ncbi:MAG: hypothetical protein HYR60_23875, partial [Acidobacteria bacterium]|nr:hypothetical protein [Acidobacteriota bacterium]
MRRIPILGLALAGLMVAQKPPFDAEALLKLGRISDPRISPDGQTVAYTVTSIDI